jgi:hypothetical protein
MQLEEYVALSKQAGELEICEPIADDEVPALNVTQ